MGAVRGRLVVISGPSGGGKTTVVKQLLRRDPALVRSVSVTTRRPRRGERTGRDYRFISRAVFDRMRLAGELLEHATVHGASYGTPRAPAEEELARGRDVVLSIDVQGARQVRRALGREALLIFLLPPSAAILRQRLMNRRTDAPSSIRRRLTAARREISCASWYDYQLVNDRVQDTVIQLEEIVAVSRASTRRPRNRGSKD